MDKRRCLDCDRAIMFGVICQSCRCSWCDKALSVGMHDGCHAEWLANRDKRRDVIDGRWEDPRDYNDARSDARHVGD